MSYEEFMGIEQMSGVGNPMATVASAPLSSAPSAPSQPSAPLATPSGPMGFLDKLFGFERARENARRKQQIYDSAGYTLSTVGNLSDEQIEGLDYDTRLHVARELAIESLPLTEEEQIRFNIDRQNVGLRAAEHRLKQRRLLLDQRAQTWDELSGKEVAPGVRVYPRGSPFTPSEPPTTPDFSQPGGSAPNAPPGAPMPNAPPSAPMPNQTPGAPMPTAPPGPLPPSSMPNQAPSGVQTAPLAPQPQVGMRQNPAPVGPTGIPGLNAGVTPGGVPYTQATLNPLKAVKDNPRGVYTMIAAKALKASTGQGPPLTTEERIAFAQARDELTRPDPIGTNGAYFQPKEWPTLAEIEGRPADKPGTGEIVRPDQITKQFNEAAHKQLFTEIDNISGPDAWKEWNKSSQDLDRLESVAKTAHTGPAEKLYKDLAYFINKYSLGLVAPEEIDKEFAAHFDIEKAAGQFVMAQVKELGANASNTDRDYAAMVNASLSSPNEVNQRVINFGRSRLLLRKGMMDATRELWEGDPSLAPGTKMKKLRTIQEQFSVPASMIFNNNNKPELITFREFYDAGVERHRTGNKDAYNAWAASDWSKSLAAWKKFVHTFKITWDEARQMRGVP